MADWKDIVGLVAPYAPTLGKMLGGLSPVPGGSLLGEWAGQKIAEQFGVPATPEAVGQALAAVPNPGVYLAPAEGIAEGRWQALAEIAKAEATDRSTQSTAINETIRSEIAKGVSWYHWRHLMGYATLMWTVAVLPPFLIHAWFGDAGKLAALTNALTAILPWYGIQAALNGYIGADSNRLKETAITGQQRDSVVAAVAKRVVGR